MKTVKNIASAIIPLSFVLPLPVNAQTVPITVSATEGLNFGSFYTVGSSGDVIINTLGVRTTAGGVAVVTGAGLQSEGKISISASTGVIMTISMTSPNFNVTNADGDMMVVNDFNIDTVTGGDNITKILATSPSTIPIGGTLNVPLNAPEGVYIGDYTVSVMYQ